MGLTYLAATVMNPADPKKRVKIEFLVDSGAIYSVVPKAALKRLGIKPCGSKEFTLADGTKIIRKFGNALFSIQETPGASPVIFGERGDSTLLGMVSLEALGYILDPLRRELRPLPMVLG
jgi:clan AA aspartic protease